MGRIVKPKYRLEYWDASDTRPDVGPLVQAWRAFGPLKGKPDDRKLEAWVYRHVDSLKLGGCNEHISVALGYIPIPHRARIVNQFTGDIVATWKATMFMAI